MIVLLSVDVIVLGANIQKLFMIASILTKNSKKFGSVEYLSYICGEDLINKYSYYEKIY